MGAVTGMLGLGGGASGTGFAGPSSGGGAVNPFDQTAPSQIQNAYTGVQGSLGQQQQLLQALQGQNGLNNQSQVYGQEQGIVNGTGPNPAQAMLNQQTGQNVANQAALMAGQRGAGANVGLIARQAAMQGANTQQQAVGQGATMQANQSLNALSNAGTIAGNQVSNQIGATGTNTQAQQNEQGQLLGALAGYNSTNAGLQANINSANASLANTSMQGQQALVGGGLNAAGAAMGFAKGGEISSTPGARSSFGQFLSAQPMAEGGEVPAMVSPGERFLPPKEAKAVAEGKKNPLQAGEKIPGTPKYPGNDYRNDVVPKTLEAGGVVIPNKILQSKNPGHEAKKFVDAVMAKKKRS